MKPQKPSVLTEICRLFVIPQRIIRVIMPFVQGMGALGLSRDKRAEHVHYLLSLVDELKYGDPSNRDGPSPSGAVGQGAASS